MCITQIWCFNSLITIFQYNWFPLSSHAFYFTHLKTFSEREFIGFTRLPKPSSHFRPRIKVAKSSLWDFREVLGLGSSERRSGLSCLHRTRHSVLYHCPSSVSQSLWAMLPFNKHSCPLLVPSEVQNKLDTIIKNHSMGQSAALF